MALPGHAENLELAPVGRLEAHQHVDLGAFSGAIRSEQTDAGARLDLEVERIHGDQVAERSADSGKAKRR
jgi:hypothetical protein